MDAFRNLTRSQTEYSRGGKMHKGMSTREMAGAIWESKYQLLGLIVGISVICFILPMIPALVGIVLLGIALIGGLVVGRYFPQEVGIGLLFLVLFFVPIYINQNAG